MLLLITTVANGLQQFTKIELLVQLIILPTSAYTTLYGLDLHHYIPLKFSKYMILQARKLTLLQQIDVKAASEVAYMRIYQQL